VVQELAEERRAGGHVGDQAVPVVGTELRVGDEPHRTFLQRVLGVEDPARLADVDERGPAPVVGRDERGEVREHTAEPVGGSGGIGLPRSGDRRSGRDRGRAGRRHTEATEEPPPAQRLRTV
jgi:hypothetical protein